MLGVIIFEVVHAGLLCLLVFGIALPIIDTMRERRVVRTTGAKR